jgi:hypothetical protein
MFILMLVISKNVFFVTSATAPTTRTAPLMLIKQLLHGVGNGTSNNPASRKGADNVF